MTARDPAEPAPPSTPTIAPPAGGAGTGRPAAKDASAGRSGEGSPVLSLESRKSQRQRERAAEGRQPDPTRAQARLVRLNALAERQQEGDRLPEGSDHGPAADVDGSGKAGRKPRRGDRLPSVRPDDASGERGDGLVAPRPDAPRAPARGAPSPATDLGRRPASLARPKARHWAIVLSFLAVVVLPVAVASWYLWTRAAPRYVSHAGFSVHTAEGGGAMNILAGVAAITGSSASTTDSNILYEFIQSREMVRLVNERLDLRAIWSKPGPSNDPIFVYHPPGTLEDLHDYWGRMVSVYNDGGGLLDVDVEAFAPEDARAIAQAIEDESNSLVNRLSDVAQEDTTRFAQEELDIAVDRLKAARGAMTRFRNETQIVDPTMSMQSQMGLLSSLEAQLAATLIELDTLRQTAPDTDPRVEQAQRRVAVIEARMAAERAKLGLGRAPGAAAIDPTLGTGLDAGPSGGGDAGLGAEAGIQADGQAAPDVEGPDATEGLGSSDGEAFADLVGQYESLVVDQEFANQAYTVAMAAYDSALADSRRQSRYLASYIEPTLAESAEEPQRVVLALLVLTFAFLAWTIGTLAAYALRDRR